MDQAFDAHLTLTINGETLRLKNASPSMTLLEYLRRSGRTGTRKAAATEIVARARWHSSGAARITNPLIKPSTVA